MDRLAYIDCFSGISGDMALGAFVDLGVPVTYLIERLKGLPLTGFGISESTVYRHGIAAVNIEVTTLDTKASRDFSVISELIKGAFISDSVKRTSLEIFDTIAEAEAEIHGCPKQDVHFHEVGGIDAIVDIVGVALCLEFLKVDRVIGSRVPLGQGFVTSQHGTLPLPAPASLSILKGVPVYGTTIDQELVTPTGAAILSTLCSSFQGFPAMEMEKIGYGAGNRELKSQPNVLRIILGQALTSGAVSQEHHVVAIEAHMDDMNPEIYGYLMERLFEDGALDVYWTPVQMKKNRPGTLVTVFCDDALKHRIIHRILSETTSLGVRSYPVQRHTLQREAVVLDTSFGKVRMKRVVTPNGNKRYVPEFEVCKAIALKNNIPVREVYEKILAQMTGNGCVEIEK